MNDPQHPQMVEAPTLDFHFPWTPLYTELASVVLQFRERQEELLAVLGELAQRGHRVILLTDRHGDGRQTPLDTIDPFTFFASFNRTNNHADRSGVLAHLKRHFALRAPVPEQFDGVPIVHAQASWFFSYAADREEGDVDALWDLAEAAVAASGFEELPVDLFDRCLRIRSVGLAKLTMGLFWLAPDHYLPLDGNTRAYLSRRGVWTDPRTGDAYVRLLQDVRSRLAMDFPAISHAAYEEMEREQAPEHPTSTATPDVEIDEGILALAVEQTIRPVLIDEGHLYDDVEGYHHSKVIPRAAGYLERESIEEDPITAARKAIGQHRNLLSYEAAKATDLITHADPDEAREHLLDLLYGGDGLEERLRRFLAWAAPRPLPNGREGVVTGTVASFLLAVVSPTTVAFCKPTTYQRAVAALLGPGREESDPVERILHATRFYGAALRLFQERYGLPFRDLMHVHIAFYLMQTAYHKRPTWDRLGEAAAREARAVYTVEDALEDLFVDDETFRGWLDVLRAKKNVILQGPPGVGKTFVAKRLAYALLGERDPERVEMVQFHQAYTYEDFVQGYRPRGDGGFALRKGPFYRFCERAARHPGDDFVFVIDEVNRGNLGKIFGELMILIEPDKRGPEWAIPLTYGSSEAALDDDTPEPRFYVPANVHLLGMMNTADRSLALVDYALRRRFAFVTLEPRFGVPRFRAYLQGRGASGALVDLIIKRMEALNNDIRGDRTNLGAGFCIGHSYFCAPGEDGPLDEAWYRRVIALEVAPLIREYWFDQPAKADDMVAALLSGKAA